MRKKVLSLALIVLLFLSFQMGIYCAVTRRCQTNFGDGKMILVEEYLPFAVDTRVVPAEGEMLSGELPVLDGATALLPVYSAAFRALYPENACAFSEGAFLPESKMQYRNTVGAYRAIVDGDADLIFCAAPSEEQLAYAAEQGVELELTPIGKEAFVFLVNAENPVNMLSAEQIRGIYAGEIRNWREVGGANRPIAPLQRKEGSGSQSAMKRFMDRLPMKRTPSALFGAGIGFSFRFYVEDVIANTGVKLLAVDGVYPDPASIADGTYPLTSFFYAVSRKGEANPNVRAIIDWLLSEEGQRMIEETGYGKLCSE